MKLIIFLLFTFSNIVFAMQNSLPILKNYSKTLQNKYNERIKSLGSGYTPRTKHLNPDGSAVYVNDLIFEESPYLIQHAHNPVNWQAWSPPAFAQAKQENKPIFISIGYATCHWCHVMEHESFEDIAIAQYINEHFVAIKVDRERRTAIDNYYMASVQMMTGHGGWPMSNFTIPDGKPFFGGTYYRPTQFLTLLKRINEVWHSQQDELIKQAKNIDSAINRHLSQAAQVTTIDDNIYPEINAQLLSMHDELQGGFSAAPKFPQEPWLLYLLSQDNSKTKTILEFTLQQMLQGGIYDQIGGGFHRYSVDNEWLAPHFEKMLYNQSQLSEVYTQAALQFNNPEFERIAMDILDYVLAEMTSQQHGVFYSAGDADSEGVEGWFFTWTETELQTILPADEFAWLKDIYHFSKNGNFEQRNILNLSETLPATAKRLKLPYAKLITQLDKVNAKLYATRKKRIHPLIDNKIITSWNAQIIYSLANTGYLFDKKNYLKAASKAMDYLFSQHRNAKNQLVRNSLGNKASNINAELEDYAWMITALIKLYDVTTINDYLIKAHTLIQQSKELFIDKQQGGFFDNIPEDNIPNTSRIKQSEDGAVVTANGQMLIALARYYRRTGDMEIQHLYAQTLAHFSGKIVTHPLSHTTMLRAKNIVDKGENNNIAYVANGKVKIVTKRIKNTVQLSFSIQPSWHINSNIAGVKALVPMTIKTEHNLKFNYPPAVVSKLSFNENDLSTFSGEFTITADIPVETKFPLQLQVSLQACSDKICLAPSAAKLKVFRGTF